VGTIGHVDHGKTTLTAAITKVLASKHGKLRVVRQHRQAAENVSAASRSPRRTWSTRPRSATTPLDCRPCDYVKNMITRAQMDRAIIVGLGADGRSQSREHILLARQVRALYRCVRTSRQWSTTPSSWNCELEVASSCQVSFPATRPPSSRKRPEGLQTRAGHQRPRVQDILD